MYNAKKVSLVFPVYNEEKNLEKAIKDFKTLGIFDEIIVVDNNSKDNSVKIAEKFGAKVVKEKRQGYGFALRRGMKEAKGDLIVLSEPDGTFVAKDVFRLLKYIDDYDLVLGTRTNKNYINKKANMGEFLRLGNYFLAKITQILFLTNTLTDCGCTFRVLKREVVKKLLPNLEVGGSHFLPEVVMNAHLSGFSFQEIPVHYRRRIGTSKITGSKIRSIKVGLRMLSLILRIRINSLGAYFSFPK